MLTLQVVYVYVTVHVATSRHVKVYALILLQEVTQVSLGGFNFTMDVIERDLNSKSSDMTSSNEI